MKTTLLFLSLSIVIASIAQTTDRKVYINPAIGFYRLTTDPASINQTPFMVELKVGTDIGKRGIIGFQFSSVLQNQFVNRRARVQSFAGPFFQSESGNQRHRVTALGFFYERIFSIGKHIDLFPGMYIQYLDYKETEKGIISTPLDTTGTYSREEFNNYSGRIGLNLNLQYRIGKSLAVTCRFAQFDCRIWDADRKNISAELPFLLGVKFSY